MLFTSVLFVVLLIDRSQSTLSGIVKIMAFQGTSYKKSVTKTVRVKVIHDVEERMFQMETKSETYGTTHCINEDSQICRLNIDRRKVSKVKKGQFLLLRNVNQMEDMSYRITHTTTIFQTGAFVHNEQAVKEFLEPEVVRIDTAVKQTNKRRISLTGFVEKTEDFYSKGHKRRVVHISPEKGLPAYKVKLWNDKAETPVPVETNVIITNLNIGEYKGVAEFNSTNDTLVEKDQTEEILEGDIEGVDFDSDNPSIFISGRCFGISKEQLAALYPDDVYVERCVSLKTNGSNVSKIFDAQNYQKAYREFPTLATVKAPQKQYFVM